MTPFYERDGVVIYHTDCLNIIGEIEADAVITDPPYGMEWVGNQRFSGGNAARGRGTAHVMITGDNVPFDPAPILSLDVPSVLWGANHFWDKLPPGASLVWQKRNEGALGTFLSDGEIAFLSQGHGVYIFPKVFAGSCRAIEGGVGIYDGSLHPNQKPIALMWWSMERAKVPIGATVLDPYMGSGTTAIACIRTGRKFIGVEIDEAHCRTAADRIERELSQGVLAL